MYPGSVALSSGMYHPGSRSAFQTECKRDGLPDATGAVSRISLERFDVNRAAAVLIGLTPAAFAGIVVAQSRSSSDPPLMTAQERASFRRLTPANQKALIADLEHARACISDFAGRDGRKDADAAAKTAGPQFYTGMSDGFVVYSTVPAITDCPLDFTATGTDTPFFRHLPDAYSGPIAWTQVQQRCSGAAIRYALTFNRTLASLRPDILRAACPAGTLDAE
jgi:hypothetical protein